MDGSCPQTVPSGMGRAGTARALPPEGLLRGGQGNIPPQPECERGETRGSCGQERQPGAAGREGCGRKGTGGSAAGSASGERDKLSPKAEEMQVPGRGQGAPAMGRDPELPDSLSQDL